MQWPCHERRTSPAGRADRVLPGGLPGAEREVRPPGRRPNWTAGGSTAASVRSAPGPAASSTAVAGALLNALRPGPPAPLRLRSARRASEETAPPNPDVSTAHKVSRPETTSDLRCRQRARRCLSHSPYSPRRRLIPIRLDLDFRQIITFRRA